MTGNNKMSTNYQDLMLYRIHEILLIASDYDSYILEEDGRLTEQILNEYIGMIDKKTGYIINIIKIFYLSFIGFSNFFFIFKNYHFINSIFYFSKALGRLSAMFKFKLLKYY